MNRAIVAILLLGGIALSSCAAPSGPRDQGGVRRVRFEEDRVTCYVVSYGISCLRDAPSG